MARKKWHSKIPLKWFFIPFIYVFFGSCEGGTTGGCESCDSFTVPDSLGLQIHLSIDKDNPYVPIAVYKGNVDEDREPLFRDTLSESPVTYLLPVEQKYGVAAHYTVGKKTVIAMDGDKVDYRSVTDCEEDCYSFREGEVDVQLD